METETIHGEDWCPSCRRAVDEWVVSFEETIHCEAGQYERIRRCPFCHEKCVEDRSSTLGCALMFVGIFGIPLMLGLIGQQIGMELSYRTDHDLQNFIVLCASVIGGRFMGRIAQYLMKQFLYRSREKHEHDQNLKTNPEEE